MDSNMIAKNYRIYRIFNNIFITRTVITDMQLVKTTSVVVSIDMVSEQGHVRASSPPTKKVYLILDYTHHWLDCSETSANQSRCLVYEPLLGMSFWKRYSPDSIHGINGRVWGRNASVCNLSRVQDARCWTKIQPLQ